MLKKEYITTRISYRVTKDFKNEFNDICKKRAVVASKLKRNWALNFMSNIGFENFKIKRFELYSDINPDAVVNDQVYFNSIEEKTSFLKYCESKGISASDFFRTCQENFIISGDPAQAERKE